MKNRLIGGYDMVFALSESKINSELETLWNRQFKKESTWRFFVQSKEGKILRSSDEGFQQAQKAWDQPAGFGRYYDAFLDAEIYVPTIHLAPGTNQEVLLKISVKSGYLHYVDANEVKKESVGGCIYAFNVPLAKVRIDANEMYYAGEDAHRQLREDGLSANDFTIESIMLNFGRADIARYSAADSTLPAEPRIQKLLQHIFTLYFKAVGENKQNPFVLGYTLKKKNLSQREQSMLYPTGASYSTSASSVDRASAFNFMLLTDNHPYPDGPEAGNIPTSLIESRIDTTETVNGVIAIDWQVFSTHYLDDLHQAIIESLKLSFSKQGLGGLHLILDDSKTNKYIAFRYEKDNVHMTIHLERTNIYPDNNGIAVEYEISINGVAKKTEEHGILFLKSNYKIEQSFSTEGRYEIDNKKARKGKINIHLAASSQGKLQANIHTERPLIGRDTEKPTVTKESGGLVDMIFAFTMPAITIFNVIDAVIFTSGNHQIINDQLLNEIELFSIDDFSNRVILPGSNVYTFKNIRMKTGGQGSGLVLFDISYAPATA